MKLTAEISLYPLHDEYIPVIQEFIDKLNETTSLKVNTTSTSTQISGDYDSVMQCLNKEIKKSFETHGKAIFVCKLLMGDLITDD